jgi:hypothetical protein
VERLGFPVADCCLLRQPPPKQHWFTGAGWVLLKNVSQSAEAAAKLHGMPIDGRKLAVTYHPAHTTSAVAASASANAPASASVSAASAKHITTSSDHNEAEALRATVTCVVCMDARRDTTLGCGHTAVCSVCLTHMRSPQKCPVCNTIVTTKIKMYL